MVYDHACALVGRCRHLAANQSGVQLSTVRNLALAWILTLPAAVILAGGLFGLFSQVF